MPELFIAMVSEGMLDIFKNLVILFGNYKSCDMISFIKIRNKNLIDPWQGQGS
jgi:hypothetical protein